MGVLLFINSEKKVKSFYMHEKMDTCVLSKAA